MYTQCVLHTHTRTHDAHTISRYKQYNVSHTCIDANIYTSSVMYRKKEHIVSVVHIPYEPDIRMINFQCVQSI